MSAEPNERRLEHVDLVRGYALLGVLLVNINYWFRAPQQLAAQHAWPGALDRVAEVVLRVGFATKSLTLFSMLFAVGLSMQRESILAKGMNWGAYVSRRLAALAVIGVLHLLFVWHGDILTQYVVTALLILPFLKRKPKTLSWWVGALFGLMATGVVVASLVMVSKRPTAGAPSFNATQASWARELIYGYAQTSWLAVTRTRLWDWGQSMRMAMPNALILLFFNFLLGLWIWSRGVLQDPAAHRKTIGRVAAWGIGLGIVASLPVAFVSTLQAFQRDHRALAKAIIVARVLCQFFGAMVLAVGIGAALVWLWQNRKWRELLRPLTAVGRMGLTNYILQSVICSFVFYGWGLGLYNRVGPALGALMGLGIFAVQVAFSGWWLKRFHFGPLEWAWRSISYGRAARFRRMEAADPEGAKVLP
jgi:uncharacterized protein